ncbi:MAG: TonB-dependent receptor [Alphaproteobacteria bacterium]|nr:TonB-dependent receptor [Alphaproteobacteria bacterium]
MIKIIHLFVVLLFTLSINAQNPIKTYSIFVKNKNHEALPNVELHFNKNTTILTDSQGLATIKISKGTILFTKHIAYQPLQIKLNNDTLISLTLTERIETIDEVVVLGSRSSGLSKSLTTAPVDVFDLKKITGIVPQASLNEILNNLAPSFTSTPQVISNGTDFIEPATIRGLSPDQTLVLINGKRRYTSALVNVNGTIGRGSVVTDLNAIPVNAIGKIELLRDGASAQYGSDAIAGVLNIQLKNQINQGAAVVYYGLNNTNFLAYNQLNSGNFQTNLDPVYFKNNITDGQKLQTSLNYGWQLGKHKQSFINISVLYESRNPTNRAGERTGFLDNRQQTDAASIALLNNLNITRKDLKLRAGQSETMNYQLVTNGQIALSPDAHHLVYFNVILSQRYGNAAGFYRLPYQNVNIPIVYPKGFLPELNSNIFDKAITIGLKGILPQSWHFDISNVYGGNSVGFFVTNSINPSTYYYGVPSLFYQSKFDAGKTLFNQNTTNVDITKKFDNNLNLNLAFGAEIRYENYVQIEGEPASWGNYTRVNSKGILDLDNGTPRSFLLADGTTGIPAGGSQVFSGLTDSNASNNYRISEGVYGELELAPVKGLLLIGALRFENYSDFGSNLSAKLAGRYTILPNLNIRASASSGFRAPSLQQKYLAKTSSIVQGSVLNYDVTLPNNSLAAQLLGIPNLKPEISYSSGIGLTYKLHDFGFTIDYFYTLVYDKIILTDAFTGSNASTATSQDRAIYNILAANNATRAVFIANALNLSVAGLDITTNYKYHFNTHTSLNLELATSFLKRDQIGNIKSSQLLKGNEHIFLSPINKSYIFDASPNTKGYVAATLKISKLSVFSRLGYFGAATHTELATISNAVANQYGANIWYYKQELSGKFLTDITIGYRLSNLVHLELGASNLFDIYPDVLVASKGQFLQLDINPNSPTYNTIIRSLNAKDAGQTNNDATSNFNQLNYSRRVSQFGINGRFMFFRAEITF